MVTSPGLRKVHGPERIHRPTYALMMEKAIYHAVHARYEMSALG